MKYFLAVLSLIAVVSLGLPRAFADTTTFNFNGTCADCMNPQGQLVLENYTDGTELSAADLVSFTYTSNLADVLVTPSNVTFLSGSLGSTAGSYDFSLRFTADGQAFQFGSFADGNWCYGLADTCSDGGGSIGIDHGTNGVFSQVVAASAPEPGSLALLGTAGAGLLAFARRRLQRTA